MTLPADSPPADSMSADTPPVNARPTRPRTAWKGWLVLAVVAGLTYLAGHAVGFSISTVIDNWHNGVRNLLPLTQPEYAFFPKTLPALAETLEMAVIATAVSAALGLPVAFLASRATNPSHPLLLAVRGVMNVVRAVPDILSAAILVSIVGVGALSGAMALVLFDVAIIVKLVSEALDAIDLGAHEAALAAGATWTTAARSGVLSEILPAYASQVLYTLELNVRASTVIGLVGAGGLGVLIDQERTFYRYHAVGMIILEILVVVVVIETLSSWLRGRLTR